MKKVKNKSGKLVCLNPNKTETVAVMDFSNSRTIYLTGKKIEETFPYLQLCREAAHKNERKSVRKAVKMPSELLEIGKKRVIFNIAKMTGSESVAELKL